jgi:hypothetical protein
MPYLRPSAGKAVPGCAIQLRLGVDLAGGRTIIVPLAWYNRLLSATIEQRSRSKDRE